MSKFVIIPFRYASYGVPLRYENAWCFRDKYHSDRIIKQENNFVFTKTISLEELVAQRERDVFPIHYKHIINDSFPRKKEEKAARNNNR
jgi:hypothetical protein